jgi:hypothetical protein
MAKRRKRMKPWMAWTVVDSEGQWVTSPLYDTKPSADGEAEHWGDGFRVAHVLVRELHRPSERPSDEQGN